MDDVRVPRQEPPAPPAKKHRRFKKKLLIRSLAGLIVLAILAGGGWFLFLRDSSPVPGKIQSAVSFPIYYPDPKKLPAGYILNTSSFTNPVKNGVSYSVDYGEAKKIVFSVQPKPSDSELQTFEANYIPLNTKLQTPAGEALLGAYYNHGTTETMVSLPTNDSAWLIITAPYNINQDRLKQVLLSVKK